MRTLTMLFLMACPLTAQLPDLYRQVDRVVWVVDDFDRYAQGWQKLDLIRVDTNEVVELKLTFRGRPVKAKLRKATGYLGDVKVEWIQPLEGQNAFAEYQARHKQGIFSLMHRIPDEESLKQETARLKSQGVEILQSTDSETWFDTEPQGKYALGLVVSKPTDPPPVPQEKRVVQFAFAVHDLHPVSDYWAKLGLGAMAFTKGNVSDSEYHGKPTAIEQAFGWQRARKVVYEWLQPITTPNTFDDHMNAYGEGVHHIAFNVPNMEQAVAAWKSKAGLPVASSGAWGEKGKPGSGRFAYIDTQPIGGVISELLWNSPRDQAVK